MNKSKKGKNKYLFSQHTTTNYFESFAQDSKELQKIWQS